MLNLIQKQANKHEVVLQKRVYLHNFSALNSKNKLLPAKIVGETKHYPPAIKEWNNSVYTFDRNYLKSLPAKDLTTQSIIKSYFALNSDKRTARSRRMRSLIHKNTGKKIFTSKPEIKQTNDKVIVTISTYNREKLFWVRKMYFYNRYRHLLNFWRKENSLKLGKINNTHSKDKLNLATGRVVYNDNYISKHTKVDYKISSSLMLKGINNKKFNRKNTTKIRKLSILKRLNFFYATKLKLNWHKRKNKNIFKIKSKRIKFKRHIPYSGIKFRNEMNFLSFKLSTQGKQFMLIRKLFYFHFLKYVLSMFKIKVYTERPESILEEIEEDGKINIYFTIKRSRYVMNIDLKDNLNYLLKTNELDRLNFILSNINIVVLQYLNNILALSGVSSPDMKLYKLFDNFCKKFYLIFLNRNMKNEILMSSYYIKLMVNRFKFNKFLPGLKLLISRIYNKKAELNIINLKYPHLNADIYTESIALKLRKKTGVLRVLKKALGLVKLPLKFYLKTNEYDTNNINSLNVYESLKLKNLPLNFKEMNNDLSTDYVQKILTKLYPHSMVDGKVYKDGKALISQDNKVISGKLMNILKTIKYKWVTGVRLEAAGRLTRRYTASRSMFKLKYKGSLKNIDYARKLEFLKKSMPSVMLRNQDKPNLQYTSTKSKKRIGAFGIKGWISGY